MRKTHQSDMQECIAPQCSEAKIFSLTALKRTIVLFFNFTRPSNAKKELFVEQNLLSDLRLDRWIIQIVTNLFDWFEESW